MCKAMGTFVQMCFLLILFSLHRQAYPSCNTSGEESVSEILSQNEGSFLNITYLLNISENTVSNNKSSFYFDLCQNNIRSALCKFSMRGKSQNFTATKYPNVSDDTFCVVERRHITSDLITWEIKISMLLTRSITDISFYTESKTVQTQTLLQIPLDVKYPSKVTNLTVDGQEVSSTHLLNEGQQVNVWCSFNRGNPPAVFNLLDKNGKEIANKVDDNRMQTDNAEEHLNFSLSAMCQDDWPTVRCEGNGSERNRSVSLLVRCAPQFVDSPVTLVSSEFEKVKFHVKAHTTTFNACSLTPPPLQDTFIPKLKCNLSGEPPNLVLMLHPEGNITQGNWKIILANEIGSASKTVNITEYSMSEATAQRVEAVGGLTIVLSCGGVLLATVIVIVIVIRVKRMTKGHKNVDESEVTSRSADIRTEPNDTIEEATMIVNDLYDTTRGAKTRCDVSHTFSPPHRDFPLPLTASEAPARPPRGQHVPARDEVNFTQSDSPPYHETHEQTYFSSADVRKNKKMKKKGRAEEGKGDIHVSVGAVRKEKKRAIKDSTTPAAETDNTTETALSMEKPSRQRNADGLIYGDLVFTAVNSPKAVSEIETKTEYASIATTAIVPPPRDYKK